MRLGEGAEASHFPSQQARVRNDCRGCKRLKGTLISAGERFWEGELTEKGKLGRGWGTSARQPCSECSPMGGSLGASVATCLQEHRTRGRPKAEVDPDGVTLDLGLGWNLVEVGALVCVIESRAWRWGVTQRDKVRVKVGKASWRRCCLN